MSEIGEYIFYWRDGTFNVLHGDSPTAAASAAGYGAGAMSALDFWDYGGEDREEYVWNARRRAWEIA